MSGEKEKNTQEVFTTENGKIFVAELSKLIDEKLEKNPKAIYLDLDIQYATNSKALPEGFQEPVMTENSVVYARSSSSNMWIACVGYNSQRGVTHFFFIDGYEFVSVAIFASSQTYSVTRESLTTGYPYLSDAVKTDGKTYGLMNGNLELIAEAGNSVVDYDPVNATALNILDSGIVPYDIEPEMLEKVKAVIGEDIWDKLEIEIKPEDLESGMGNSVNAKIEMAKANFLERYAMKEMEQEALERMGNITEVTEITDEIQPKKDETI